MSLFEDTDPRALKELLEQIHKRDAALPEFSIACNYPAGSLLRIRNTRNLFACREFQGAPALDREVPTYLVLTVSSA